MKQPPQPDIDPPPGQQPEPPRIDPDPTPAIRREYMVASDAALRMV